MSNPGCRACGAALEHSFCDLGVQPIANRLLVSDKLHEAEQLHPLRPWVCGECFLVQLPEFETPARIFDDYAYFSSYSDTWLEHVAVYADSMMDRFVLGVQSRVVEIGSNDGHLLKNFKARGVPVLGVEPAGNVAQVAESAGVPTLARFFGQALAQELCEAGTTADLLVANNVLAHVPDLHDFVAGMRLVLRPSGVATLEFPHLLRLLQHTQYDTIYHEHFSYFSLAVVESVFAAHGLAVFDVEELQTHGGSLRVYARHRASHAMAPTPALERLRAAELTGGMNRLETYLSFQQAVSESKAALLELLHGVRLRAGRIAGYGAPAKASTLLNYCGIGPELIDYTVDRSPHKQGMLIPGVRVPIYETERLRNTRPECVLIFAWNLVAEILRQIDYVRAWGGKFAVPIPRARIIP